MDIIERGSYGDDVAAELASLGRVVLARNTDWSRVQVWRTPVDPGLSRTVVDIDPEKYPAITRWLAEMNARDDAFADAERITEDRERAAVRLRAELPEVARRFGEWLTTARLPGSAAHDSARLIVYIPNRNAERTIRLAIREEYGAAVYGYPVVFYRTGKIATTSPKRRGSR